MRVRVIDLDGSITQQERVLRHFHPEVFDVRHWGPRLRLASGWSRFFRFERRLDRLLGSRDGREASINLLGSSDFHHVSLAFLRRMHRPLNLLVIDHDADWRRGSPLLHSGSWLLHAARLANVQRIFVAGVDANLDGASRWLAPSSLLRTGKIVTLPVARKYRHGIWRDLPHQPLRRCPQTLLDRDRLEELLWPYLDELDRLPLYVSLDKSALWMPESVTNRDSGLLDLNELQEILQFFLKAAGNDLLGMDIAGDWSSEQTQGLMRKLLHRFGHSRRGIDADQARLCNERTNLSLLKFLVHDPIAESVTYPARLRSA